MKTSCGGRAKWLRPNVFCFLRLSLSIKVCWGAGQGCQSPEVGSWAWQLSLRDARGPGPHPKPPKRLRCGRLPRPRSSGWPEKARPCSKSFSALLRLFAAATPSRRPRTRKFGESFLARTERGTLISRTSRQDPIWRFKQHEIYPLFLHLNTLLPGPLIA